MSRAAPARRAAAEAPRLDPACPRNDDCQMRQTLALESIAERLGSVEAGLNRIEPAITQAGLVFGRWERLCVWVRAKTPKHGWWVVLLLWIVSNFVSPELKTAIQNATAVMLNNYAAGGG